MINCFILFIDKEQSLDRNSQQKCWINKWMDKQIDRKLDRQIDGQIDGRIDRQTDREAAYTRSTTLTLVRIVSFSSPLLVDGETGKSQEPGRNTHTHNSSIHAVQVHALCSTVTCTLQYSIVRYTHTHNSSIHAVQVYALYSTVLCSTHKHS